jgi:hypothetical protein
MRFHLIYFLKAKIRKKKVIGSLIIPLLVIILLISFSNTDIKGVSGYNITVYENTDADSDIDATANIGNDGATDYTDAQTLDGTDQTIAEGNGAGYVAGNNIEDFMDAVTDSQSPSDLGTIADWTELQDVDTTTTALTEEDTGGGSSSELRVVDGLTADWADWTLVGTTPYLDAQEGASYIKTKIVGEQHGFFTFTDTTKSGTLSVFMELSASLTDGDDYVNWGIDTSGDTTAEHTGSITFTAADTWYSTGVISGLDTVEEVNAARLYVIYQQGGAKNNFISLDAARLNVTGTEPSNYRFDREFSFSSLDYDEANEYLCIRTGTVGTETLDINIWHSGAWTDIGDDIEDADDNTWINISISTWLDSATEYFRFNDTTQSSDTSQNVWNLDGILIHSWTNPTYDYELQWEHQAQSIDINKYEYNLCIYGFTSDAESMEIQVWNETASGWGSVLGTTIGTSEQWYNQSLDLDYIDTTNSRCTWRYRGTSESGDTTQTTLNIDYAGITAYNFSVYGLPVTFNSLEFSADDQYHALIDSPLEFVVESGKSYDVEINGSDVIGTPITNGYIYVWTSDDSGSSFALTTSWQDFLTGQSKGNNTHYIYIWVFIDWSPGDPKIENASFEWDVNIRITEA